MLSKEDAMKSRIILIGLLALVVALGPMPGPTLEPLQTAAHTLRYRPRTSAP